MDRLYWKSNYATMDHHRKHAVSPDSALASDVFDQFCSANTFKSILGLFRHLCDILHIKPTTFPQFYPKLKVCIFYTWRCMLYVIIIIKMAKLCVRYLIRYLRINVNLHFFYSVCHSLCE